MSTLNALGGTIMLLLLSASGGLTVAAQTRTPSERSGSASHPPQSVPGSAAAVAPRASQKTINEILTLAGIKNHIAQLNAKRIWQALRSRNRIEDGDEVILTAITQVVRPEIYLARLSHSLAENYSAEEVSHLAAWLRTPLMRQMIALEAAASTTEAGPALVRHSISLRKNPCGAERLELLNRLDAATHYSESATRAQAALLQSFPGARNDDAPSWEDVQPAPEDMVRDWKLTKLPAIQEAWRRAMLFAYRTIDDKELQKYVEAWESGEGKKFISVIEQAMLDGGAAILQTLAARLVPLLPKEAPRTLAKPQDAMTAKESYGQGLRLFYAGRSAEALPFLDWALLMDPNYAIAYYKRGNLYRQVNQEDHAIADYTQAVRLKPTMALAYINRGDAHLALGHQERAVQDYSEAIRVDPELALGWLDRGLVYHKLGQYSRAIEDYNAALRLDPTYATTYADRGLAYGELRQWEQAFEDCTTAVDLSPKYEKAYACRGWILVNQKKYEKAIADYDLAIGYEPNDTYALRNRGWAYEKLGNYASAIENYSRLVVLKPHDSDPLLRRAYVRTRVKDFDGALSDCNAALALEPNNAEVYGYRAITMGAMGRRDDARVDFDRCVAMTPKCQEQFERFVRAYLD